MTMDDFEMDPHYHLYRKNEIEWFIKARDGDIRLEFSVFDENVQEVVKDNFDHFAETVEKELTERVESDWDNSLISDEEKDVFLRVLGVILA